VSAEYILHGEAEVVLRANINHYRHFIVIAGQREFETIAGTRGRHLSISSCLFQGILL